MFFNPLFILAIIHMYIRIYICTQSFTYLKGGGHANFDAEFFVPMDSLGDAQVKNNTFKLLKFH